STVFNIDKTEYEVIESFIVKEKVSELEYSNLMIANANDHNAHAHIMKKLGLEVAEENEEKKAIHFYAEIRGNLIFIHVESVDMFFVKYRGEDEIVLNGFIMQPNRVYLFSHGSTLKTPQGEALYYSDLVGQFNEELKMTKLSFQADIEEFQFPNGGIGLRNIEISEGPGKLIGIMGASGAGKTTLLNVLAGIERPTLGAIKINGFDTNAQKDKIHGVIGYVSQDDLLIEELTVYQNLYYNAKLCFANFSEEELEKRVMEVLESLGLDQRKDLKVGNPLEKTISGGQRKRLNIALELIREPAVLFVDEPTSGLSSRDSENVIDLLKELSLKGKLIFVVIHQPSSDIYKMFDKMYIMDTGGYPVFYGNPVEAVTYFKTITNQVDKERGQCEICGNVNPEQIFNIIEAKVVDEYGQLTNKRKISPQHWHDQYKENFKVEKVQEVKEEPPQSLNIPNLFKQVMIFTTRDTLSKLSNKQYLLINLLEAPLLAVILAFVIRYKSSPAGDEYIFRFNDNIPAFLLMSIIVALFMGLTVSAEEIIRDRRILKRESFLNLSWNSYLLSKIVILFTLSAIQSLTFVIFGNVILEMWGMFGAYWLVLFTVSCMANVIGLNISSAFNSAVTVYVLIPLLLIPQMIMSGLLFSFDKLNDLLSTRGKVPIVADLMASRWAYEAMAVYQFRENDYNNIYYNTERVENQADFKAAYLADALDRKRRYIFENVNEESDSIKEIVNYNLQVLKAQLDKELFKKGLDELDLDKALTLEGFSTMTNDILEKYIQAYKSFYLEIYDDAVKKRENMVIYLEENQPGYNLNAYKNKYFNESLADLVTNITVKDRLLEYKGELLQQINPIYNPPEPKHSLDYRAHFFAPEKYFLGNYMDTYYFNILVIWVMTIIFYLTLYFEVLAKLVNSFGKIKFSGKK
ncbi:MAG: ATP-binding cassette domain-containing protein, partial [Cyclobacteriaceae bacterium]|nr:ATP-binding cassette domain-containing protein [Cyclobacteriaceae bacterium]